MLSQPRLSPPSKIWLAFISVFSCSFLLLAACGTPSGDNAASSTNAEPNRVLAPEPGSPESMSVASTIPNRIDTAPVFPEHSQTPVSAEVLIKDPDGRYRIEAQPIPKKATPEQAASILNPLSERPGVVSYDYAVAPRLKSQRPADPRWLPVKNGKFDSTQPNLQVPMSRIGLCCSQDGRIDGWDITNQYKNGPPLGNDGKPKALPEVNIAILDSGLIKDHETGITPIKDDLKDRFIAGWDMGTTGVVTKYDWDAYPKSDNFVEDEHGTNVAGYALATADNKVGSAGAAGNLPNVKFGMFRVIPYEVNTTKEMEVDAALAEIINQVKAFQAGTHGGINWSVINESFGIPSGTNRNESVLMEELNRLGVSIVVAASNERDSCDDKLCAYGVNPLEYPGMMPYNFSVASWGESPKKNGQYADQTSSFSQINKFVDIAAPGEELPGLGFGESPNNGGSGTSYAAPTLAGIIASAITIGGEDVACTAPGLAEHARLACLERLRGRVLESTGDISGKTETASSQGAGVIQVPQFFRSDTVLLPAKDKPLEAPQRVSGLVLDGTPTPVATHGYYVTYQNVKIKWNPSVVAADNVVSYRLYINGDSATTVTAAQLDAKLKQPKLVNGVWMYPGKWDKFRIAWPDIATATWTIPELIIENDPAIPNVISITAVTTTKDKRRQAESLASTLRCSPDAALPNNLICKTI